MTVISRRGLLAGLSAAAALRPERALAAWPERNISLLHGLTAGGGVDVSARLIAEGLSRRLGQQVVVEPKPGAAGTLAAAQVARATPDGYTLGFIPSGHAVTAATYKALPYRSIEDFTIIGQTIEFPFVMVTHPEHSIRSIPDLIKAANTRSEPVLGGVPGAGTPQHLMLEYFSRLAGIKIQVVPFRGGNQALTELLGKRLDAFMAQQGAPKGLAADKVEVFLAAGRVMTHPVECRLDRPGSQTRILVDPRIRHRLQPCRRRPLLQSRSARDAAD